MPRFISVQYEGRKYRAYLTDSGIGRVCTLGIWGGKTCERDLTSTGPRREAIVALATEKARR